MPESLSDETIRKFMGRLTLLSTAFGPANNGLSIAATYTTLQGLTWVASCMRNDPATTLQVLAESCVPLNMIRICSVTESGRRELCQNLLPDLLTFILGATVLGLGVPVHQFEQKHRDAEAFWGHDLSYPMCHINEKVFTGFPMIVMAMGSLTTIAAGYTQQHYSRCSAIGWLMSVVLATMAVTVVVNQLLKHVRHQARPFAIDAAGLPADDYWLSSPSGHATFAALFPVLFAGFKTLPRYETLIKSNGFYSQVLISFSMLLTCMASLLSAVARVACGRHWPSNVLDGAVQELLMGTQVLYIMGSDKLYEKRDALLNSLLRCCQRRPDPVLFSNHTPETMMTRNHAMSLNDIESLASTIAPYANQYSL